MIKMFPTLSKSVSYDKISICRSTKKFKKNLKSRVNLTLKNKTNTPVRENLSQQRSTMKENKLYELKLLSKYDTLATSLSSLKSKDAKHRSSYLEVKAKFDEFKLILNGLKSESISSQKLGRLSLQSNKNLQEYNKQKTNLTLIKQKTREINTHVLEITGQLTTYEKKLEKIGNKIRKIKKKVKKNRKMLTTHYLKLLEEGTDTRTDGLVWIVCALKHLRFTITEEHFPPFIGGKTIQCILQVAEKTLETENLKQSLKKIPKSKTHVNSKKEILIDVKQRLKDMSNKSRNLSISDTDNNNTANILGINYQINQIQLQIKEIKKNEVKRLIKECIHNRSEGKLRVSLTDIVSTVIGVESINRYRSFISKVKSTAESEISSYKTFSWSLS